MKLRKVLAILLCVVMVLALAACNSAGSKTATGSPSAGGASPGGSPASQAPAASKAPSASQTPSASQAPASQAPAKFQTVPEPNRDTLNVVATQDWGTLAHENISNDMFSAVQLVNEPLWGQKKMAGLDEVFFLLAESLEVKSPTEWIIHLKKGIKFSNGNTFTASDVVFSIRKVQASKLNGAARGQLMNMDKTKIIDDYTLDFIWDAYHIGQWGIISDCLMYDEQSYDANVASTKPIGTGPYTVKEYVPNSHAFFERRDDYWGTKPEFKNINFRVMAEPSQINNALQTGMVDIAQRLANADVAHISSLPKINVNSYYDTNFAMARFNLSPASIMNKEEARRAICHAIDRAAIAKVVYNGRAEVLKRATALSCLDDEARFNNLDETYTKGYDVALAKQYADKAGLTGKTIKLMTNGTTEFVQMSEMIQSMLKDIGVTVQIVTYDPATYTTLSRDDTTPSAWDVTIGLGINPGYRVASVFIMGPRTSKVWNTPGNWPGSEEFVTKSYSFFATQDEKQRSDLTLWMMQQYEKSVLSFGICDVQTSTAIAKFIDPSSFVYRQNGGMYYALVKHAK